MKKFDQIIVGAGASAFTFLHSALHGTQTKFVHNKTLVIGKGTTQLWARIEKQTPDHEMGQPAALLRPSGLPSRPEETKDFLKTYQFNRMLGDLKEKISQDRKQNPKLDPLEYDDAYVQEITRAAQGYIVTTSSGEKYFAEQVILACGPGKGTPLEQLPKDPVSVDGPIDSAKKSGEYIDSVDYMTTEQPRGKRVLIYGGAPTSSWAVVQALAMEAKQVVWACRRGLKGIEEDANPIGRNTKTIERAKELNMIAAAEIQKITMTGDKEFEGRLQVMFKSLGDEKNVQITFDQVVYAVGPNPRDPLGPGGILTDDIRKSIEPVWDRNYRFTSWSDGRPAPNPKVITALRDSRGDLWVVGAAVARGLGLNAIQRHFSKEKNRYADIGEILALGGRPPEGIAILDGAINAVTGFQINPATFNWNKANRRDIFQILSRTYVTKSGVGIPYTVREKMVDDVVKARAASEKGLSNGEVTELMFDLKKKYGLNIDPTDLPGVTALPEVKKVDPKPPQEKIESEAPHIAPKSLATEISEVAQSKGDAELTGVMSLEQEIKQATGLHPSQVNQTWT